MDATPSYIRDEFSGYAMQLTNGLARISDSLKRLHEILWVNRC